MGLISKIRNEKNKKLLVNTLYDLLILFISSIIIIIVIDLMCKGIITINSDKIKIVSMAKRLAKNNTLYIGILVVTMYILSAISFYITTLDQIKTKRINTNNKNRFLLLVISLILTINTIILFISSSIIDNRLSYLCKDCLLTDISFYTFQINLFIKLITSVSINYVVWTLITILIIYLMVTKATKKQTIFEKLFKKKNKR